MSVETKICPLGPSVPDTLISQAPDEGVTDEQYVDRILGWLLTWLGSVCIKSLREKQNKQKQNKHINQSVPPHNKIRYIHHYICKGEWLEE